MIGKTRTETHRRRGKLRQQFRFSQRSRTDQHISPHPTTSTVYAAESVEIEGRWAGTGDGTWLSPQSASAEALIVERHRGENARHGMVSLALLLRNIRNWLSLPTVLLCVWSLSWWLLHCRPLESERPTLHRQIRIPDHNQEHSHSQPQGDVSIKHKDGLPAHRPLSFH